jgi:hypothetical protein
MNCTFPGDGYNFYTPWREKCSYISLQILQNAKGLMQLTRMLIYNKCCSNNHVHEDLVRISTPDLCFNKELLSNYNFGKFAEWWSHNIDLFPWFQPWSWTSLPSESKSQLDKKVDCECCSWNNHCQNQICTFNQHGKITSPELYKLFASFTVHS